MLYLLLYLSISPKDDDSMSTFRSMLEQYRYISRDEDKEKLA